jgi:hypothetical protein
MAFGDSDHDGLGELALYVNNGGSFETWILEARPGYTYEHVQTLPAMLPYAMTDMDGDGKVDLVGQYSYWIVVYESPDADSYPDHLVWQSPALSNIVGYLTVGDTDGDGRMEIIHSKNTFSGPSWLYIFENTGDDTYAQVFAQSLGNGASGEKTVADLDGDGRTEIALGDVNGGVYVFESPGDDAWTRVWSTQTDLYNAYGCEGGVDADGNGRRELYVFGNASGSWTTAVFEPMGNDTFGEVTRLVYTDGYLGLTFDELADLDGSGQWRYLMDAGNSFAIFEATGPGTWEVRETHPDPDGTFHAGLQAYDVNGNGLPEVFWEVEGSLQNPPAPTMVWESPGGSSGVTGDPTAGVSFLLFPNPVRAGDPLYVRGRLPDDALRVVDAAGRCVACVPCPQAGAPLSLPPLSPGAYWLVARDARVSVPLRIVPR